MNSDRFLETAQAYRVLSALEPEHLRKLLPLAQDANFDIGQIIFREGGKSMNLYLIVAGDVALESVDHPGASAGVNAVQTNAVQTNVVQTNVVQTNVVQTNVVQTNVVQTNVVQTLRAGDAMGWSALIPGSRTHFQARALTPVTAVAFPGEQLREACDRDPAIGYALLSRLLEVVTERLDATRIQLSGLHAASTH